MDTVESESMARFPLLFDVSIVGAGPAGLTLASKLARLGLSTACFEENRTLYDYPRAVALDDETLRCFQGFGLSKDELAGSLMNCAGMKYYGERGQFLVLIHPEETPYGHYKGATFYQPVLEEILLRKARECGASVYFDEKVVGLSQNDQHVTLKVRHDGVTREVVSSYVVGCDGGRSFVRKALNVKFVGRTFEQKWLIVDTQNDVREERLAEFWCNSERPVVSVPRRNGYRRWEFMLMRNETDQTFTTMADVVPLLSRYVDVSGIRIQRVSTYTFHSRHAERYRVGRVFLAGDAAHLMPPFMAQGMAAGIRDVENLAWKLAEVLKGKLSSSRLDSYEIERKPHLIMMTRITELAGAFMMPKSRTRSVFRDVVVNILTKIPGVVAEIKEARFRPEPVLVDGLFRKTRGDRLAGKMFPQPRVLDAHGSSILLDHFLGDGFAFVVFGSLEMDIAPALIEALTQLECSFVQIIPQGLLVDDRFGRLDKSVLVEDQYNQIPCWLKGYPSEIFLLRPDKFVMCSASVGGQHEVARWIFDNLIRNRTSVQKIEALTLNAERQPLTSP